MNKGRAHALTTLAGAVGTAWLLGCMNPLDSSKNNESMALSQAGEDSSGLGKGGAGKTTICHIPPGNPANAHTLTVGNPAVAAHLAYGDKLGACQDVPTVKTRPCADKAPGQSKEHEGLAPDRQVGKVAVCHIPPGNPANAHTIVVGAAAVKAHLAHGDKLGACAEGTVTVAVPVDCGGNEGDPIGGPGQNRSHPGGTTHPGSDDPTGTDTHSGTDSAGTGTSGGTGLN